jgi:hypothetical protein
MLDENLKVLGRRVADLETELGDKKDKVSTMLREKKDIEGRLNNVYKE